jgi:hypothetical protein
LGAERGAKWLDAGSPKAMRDIACGNSFTGVGSFEHQARLVSNTSLCG